MRIGFIILCRYNSSRLYGKILKEIQGKTILQYIVDSLSCIVDKSNIVVATSKEETDNPIANYCVNNDIQLFRGELNNVSKRFKDCANNYKFDFATRINGDNIFVDQETIKEMLAITKTNNFDFVSNVKNRTFPKGMSVEIVRVNHYNEKYKDFNSEDDFEHVTIYLYRHDENEKYYYHYNEKCKDAAGVQFAIDTPEDFKRAERIINKLNKINNFTLREVYNAYKSIKK
jgi:spore coat polysaccharide biosynthesis protein SpsF